MTRRGREGPRDGAGRQDPLRRRAATVQLLITDATGLLGPFLLTETSGSSPHGTRLS